MKVKLVRYSIGVLLLGLTMFFVSCAGIIEPPSPPPPVATIVPPFVPHLIEGRADCLACHERGIGGAPRYPSDHEGRPSDVCFSCHETVTLESEVATLPAASTPQPETTAAPGSAEEIYGTMCSGCHGVNRQGIPGFDSALTPESLEMVSDAEIQSVISDGRPNTVMPPFKGTLSPQEISALLQFIKYNSP